MTKLTDVYQALADLAENGICEATHKQIGRLAKIGGRHLIRRIAELRDLGMIETELIHNSRGHRAKTRYRLKALIAPMSHLGENPNCPYESLRPTLIAPMSHLGDPNCPYESLRPPLMNHDNDDDRILNRKIISSTLDFLDLNGRLKLLDLPHVDLGYAELARRYVDHLKETKQWQAQFSPGRVYRLIERNEVPTQFEMPAAVVELPEEEKAWFSQDELDLIQR